MAGSNQIINHLVWCQFSCCEIGSGGGFFSIIYALECFVLVINCTVHLPSLKKKHVVIAYHMIHKTTATGSFYPDKKH